MSIPYIVRPSGLLPVNGGALVPWPTGGGDPDPVSDPIPTTMQTSVEQYGIEVTFDRAYPVGQYVTGDYFVVGSPTVVSITPEWDGQRHGATVDPPLDRAGYHSQVRYQAPLNFALTIPAPLMAGQSLVATNGWLASDPEVVALGLTVVTSPPAPRPAIRDAMVLTAEPTAPAVGSFRPPYVAGPKWHYNAADVDASMLANLTPLGDYPSWETAAGWLARSWAPDAGYGSQSSRYFHPYYAMPDYGRDLCARMYAVILRLNTAGTPEQKTPILHKVIQYGIDCLAITRLAIDVDWKTSGAQTRTGWWADFGGGHGVGRDLPMLLAKVALGNPPEMQAVWDAGPRWQGDTGQIWVSDGDPDRDRWRSAGQATWGESPHTRPSTRRPGTTGYRTCCTARSQGAGMLAAHVMGIVDQWDHPDAPISEYIDWYVDVDQVGGGTSRFDRAWTADMWDAYRQDY